MAELWLRADYPIGPFAQQPAEQAICDVLAKVPFSAWSTGECAFRWDYVDRPAPGTAFLALLQPPGRPVPPDGLRYYYPEANDRRAVSQHVVHAPNSLTNPTAAAPVDVVLECFTTSCGHLPPMSPSQPIPQGSPDLRLTRFRKRWRIANGSQPSLWFFWFGEDESGGLGPGHTAPTAPPGWESTPARSYPLPQMPNVPSAPLYPFPSPARLLAGQAGAAASAAGQAAAAGSMAPPATPLARQQQLAALASQAGVGMQGGAANSTLEARQQQYQALAQQQQQQQQQQQAAALAAAAAASAAGVGPSPTGAMLPPGLTPQQISAAQARQAQQYMLAQQQQQQQQQQRLAAAQTPVASTPGASSRSGGAASRRKSAAAPPQSAAAAGSAQGPTPAAATAAAVAAAQAAEDAARPGDILDHLTHRQREMHRYALQHQLLAPIFDAWPTSAIMAGEPAAVQVKGIVASAGVDAETGRAKIDAEMAAVAIKEGGVAPLAIPGLSKPGPLAQLAVTAARIPIAAAKGEDLDLVVKPLEDRRAKLEEMLQAIEQQTKEEEERYQRQVAALTATPLVRARSEAAGVGAE
ncbi:hypothetical protein JCM10908_000665 [Rhodotorula pacifica]|uniref:uncharacterized protein n=1 Tax=Rhodotorula pacifica TaxID=1495444 RepID=UPI003177AA80